MTAVHSAFATFFIRLVLPCTRHSHLINSAGGLWAVQQLLFEGINGGKIEFTGEDVPMRESCVLVSNHKSFAGVFRSCI